MSRHCELIDGIPGNIYQRKIFAALRISVCKCVGILNMAEPEFVKFYRAQESIPSDTTQLNGTGVRYVDNSMVSFHFLNEISFVN